MRDGEIARSGNYKGSRWCRTCGCFHGRGYACPYYSAKVLGRVAEFQAINASNWSNREFIQKRIDEGMPLEGIYIMQMFAGLR